MHDAEVVGPPGPFRRIAFAGPFDQDLDGSADPALCSVTLDLHLAMLQLKVIWSAASVVGGVYAIATGAMPGYGWLFTVVFAAFHLLWLYYYLTLRGQPQA